MFLPETLQKRIGRRRRQQIRVAVDHRHAVLAKHDARDEDIPPRELVRGALLPNLDGLLGPEVTELEPLVEPDLRHLVRPHVARPHPLEVALLSRAEQLVLAVPLEPVAPEVGVRVGPDVNELLARAEPREPSSRRLTLFAGERGGPRIGLPETALLDVLSAAARARIGAAGRDHSGAPRTGHAGSW
jgi:hypothetical protein